MCTERVALMDTWRRRILWLGLIQCLLVVSLVVRLHGQSQDVINALTLNRLTAMEADIHNLQVLRLDIRLTVLENDIGEVKLLGRSVIGLVAAQVMAALMGLFVKRKP